MLVANRWRRGPGTVDQHATSNAVMDLGVFPAARLVPPPCLRAGVLLTLQRHEVRVTYSGMATLEMIKTYTPDVVLLDIGMPGMDGYEVARRIR